MFLSKVDPATISVAALKDVKQRFNLEDSDFEKLVGLFKSYSKDILRLRLVGINNYFNCLSNPDSYPEDIRNRYTTDSFKVKYSYDFQSVSKAYNL